MLEKPQVWGIFGNWKDLDDAEGRLAMEKYTRHCFEYCLDVDKEKTFFEMKEKEANGEVVFLGALGDDEENEMKRGYGIVSNDKDCYEFCLDMDGGVDNCK